MVKFSCFQKFDYNVDILMMHLNGKERERHTCVWLSPRESMTPW